MKKETLKQTERKAMSFSLLSLGLLALALLPACGYTDNGSIDAEIANNAIRPVAAPTPTFYGETPAGIAFPTEAPANEVEPVSTPAVEVVPSAPRP